MTYIAKLLLGRSVLMARYGRTEQEAIDALGGVAGPGYRIVTERVAA